MRFVLLAVLVAGCGVEPGVSDCGATYYDSTMALHEGRILLDLELFAKWPQKRSCERLKGYSIERRGDVTGFAPDADDAEEHRLWGQTDCKAKRIELAPMSERVTLAHELAHAAQKCETVEHEGWDMGGVWTAIRASVGD